MRRILILGAALLVGVWLIMMQRTQPSDCPKPGEIAAIGQPAPCIQLKDLDGRLVSLSDFKGKVVLLDFWATWCGPCRLTMPVLEQLQQEHPNDFTLLAVNLGESRNQVLPFTRAQKIQSRVLLDIDERVGRAYESGSIPMQVLIDQEGIVRHTQLGAFPGWKEQLWSEISKLRNY
jgi:thiol-disulfide isomerase/thioredoxin